MMIKSVKDEEFVDEPRFLAVIMIISVQLFLSIQSSQ